jgi:Skp family chaperone for outer membrane proteins
MFIKRALAGTTLAAMLALLVPAAPALANGAASTRNILIGIGAATYLIIQHNRKVHEKYAEYDRRQAELQSENSDAWAAYSSEKNAYSNAIAEVSDLKREVAYQHNVVEQLRHQLAMSGRNAPVRQTAFAAPASRGRHTTSRHVANANDVAMVSYGWGQI